jgi:hypothetical protein
MSDLKNELITAYEDILTCKYVESWSDLGECHSITTEGAIKIAKRLLELDSNNVIANDTLDIEEGLLLIQYTNNEYALIHQMGPRKVTCGVMRNKLIPRHITTLEEALKFAGWGDKE